MSNRSLKEWQLTVERMASHAAEQPYTDKEADDIIAFLYLGKHDPGPPGWTYEEAAAARAVTQPAKPASASVVVSKPKFRVSWRKSKATWVAKLMGHVAAALLACLVASGLVRKWIPRYFRSIHVVLAIGLFGALAIHASVYLCEYGAPGVLWLWFGIAASVLVALVEFGGLLRAKLGGAFIRVHSICGCAGLLLVLLHWFWIYL